MIAALLTQRNLEEAAKTAGIGTRTLLRWMKQVLCHRRHKNVTRWSVKYCEGAATCGPAIMSGRRVWAGFSL